MARLLIASFIFLHAGCTLVTCDDICDGKAGGAGGASGGTAGGTAGGATAGGSGGGGGDAGGAAGGDAGGMAGGDAGGMAGGDAGGGAAGGAAGGAHTSIAFVTNATFHGNFMAQAPGFLGAAAADRLCSNAASNASLPGTFKAWVSGAAGISASSRLIDSGPWELRNSSIVVFQNKAAMGGFPAAPINRNENGFLIAGTSDVWTGATSSFVNGANCMTWSTNSTTIMPVPMGVKGSAMSTAQWTNTSTPQACNLLARLYCFEQQ